jgi:hypothetical protein
VRRDLQRERKSRDAAAENEVIELFHASGALCDGKMVLSIRQIGNTFWT